MAFRLAWWIIPRGKGSLFEVSDVGKFGSTHHGYAEQSGQLDAGSTFAPP
jgi:hypothetical protein